MDKKYTISVDFQKSVSHSPINFIENDFGTCNLSFDILQDITGLDVFVTFALPDGTFAILQAVFANSHRATLLLPTGVLIPGTVTAQIALYDGPDRLTNYGAFTYTVGSDYSESAVTASDNYPILTQLIEDVEGLLDEVMTTSIYDPDGITKDVFDIDNQKESTTKKVMTAEERTKLSGIADNANNYTHPASHPPAIITQDSDNRFVTDIEKGIWNAKQPAMGADDNYVTDAEKVKLTNLSGTNSGDETTQRIGTLINSATTKTVPADADMVGLMDSASGNILKKLSWANIKTAMATYYDSLASTLTNKTLTSPKINENVVLTPTSTELNYVDGVTSPIQTQFTNLGNIVSTINGSITEDALFSTLGIPNPEPNITITNLFANGSMELGTTTPTTWVSNYGSFTGISRSLDTSVFKVGTKSVKIVSDGSNTSSNNYRLEQTITTIVGHVYHLSAWFNCSVVGKAGLQFHTNTPQLNTLTNEWERKSRYFTASATSYVVTLWATYSNANTAVTSYIDGAIVTDLTAAYGAGNEPLIADFESYLIQKYPTMYYEGAGYAPQIGVNNGKLIAVVDDVVKMASIDEFAVIGDSYSIGNLVTNPLITDATGWTSSYATLSALDNELIITGAGTGISPRAEQLAKEKITTGETYRLKTKFKAIDAGITSFSVLVFGTTGGTVLGGSLVNNPVVGTDYEYENDFLITNQTGNISVFFSATYANAGASSGKTWSLGKTELINLTKDFPDGNYPTKQYLSELFERRFDGIFAGRKIVNDFTDKLKYNKVVCFGDSITGSYKYPTVLKTLSKADVVNCGIGGTRMTGGISSDYSALSMVSLADAYATSDWSAQDVANGNLNLPQYALVKALDLNAVDYVVMFFGTNDYWGGTTIGTSASDSTTYVGAINHIVNTLLTNYPHLKITFVTPMFRARFDDGDGLDSDVKQNANGNYLIDFTNAEVTACNLNHIPVLDMYKNCGITKYNHLTYLEDGLHPNPTGEILIARKIHKFIDAIL